MNPHLMFTDCVSIGKDAGINPPITDNFTFSLRVEVGSNGEIEEYRTIMTPAEKDIIHQVLIRAIKESGGSKWDSWDPSTGGDGQGNPS